MKKDEKYYPGYPLYPPGDDIYSNDTETEIDPDNLFEDKLMGEKNGRFNEKEFDQDMTGEDLDVPGSEYEEDGGESIGMEDEENEYYSLGGDDHNDLDEDNG